MTRASAIRSRGFTLIELLTVISIISVLSALLFSVIGSAKAKAFQTTDISGMRQLYAGICLYEQDQEDQSPPSLVMTERYAGATDLFRSRADSIGKRPSYPADLFVPESERRSSFRISYSYLRPFEARYSDPTSALGASGVTWPKMRATPNIGMLADTWFIGRDSTNSFVDEHGPVLKSGVLLRIQMDGSLRTLTLSNINATGPSLEELFLNSLRGAPFVQ